MEWPSEYLDQLRERLPLEPIIREDVGLNEIGRSLRGRCPGHGDVSESLHVGDNLFNCFACGQGGDVIAWTMARQDLDRHSAIAHLTRRAGLPPYAPG